MGILDNNDDYQTDPGFKAARGSVGGGGSGPIGGGGAFGSASFGGGGGLLGSLNTTTGGNEAALRRLLRQRMRLPASGAPSYLGGAPAADGSALATLVPGMGGGRFGSADTSGLSRVATMTTSGVGGGIRNPSPLPSQGVNSGSGSNRSPYGGKGGWHTGSGGGGGTQEDNKPGGLRGGEPINVETILDIIKQFRDAGFYSPEKNQALFDSVRSNAVGDAQALMQRNRLTAQSMGTDPATAASYALQSDLQGQGNVSDALNKTALQQLLNRENLSQDLLKTYLSGMLGRSNDSGGGGTDWGSILGGLGGLIAAF